MKCFDTGEGRLTTLTPGTAVFSWWSDDPRPAGPRRGRRQALGLLCLAAALGVTKGAGAYAAGALTVASSTLSGDGHTCALQKDGTAACIGDNQYGQSLAPAGTFSALAAGDKHTCGLRPGGQVVCWGGSRPHALTGEYVQIASDMFATLGLRADGSVWADEAPQVQVAAGPFTAISASAGSGGWCGLRADGTAWCSRFGEAPASGLTQVSLGYTHACGLHADGLAVCWDAAGVRADTPALSFSQIGASRDHTCGLGESGEVACWGRATSDLARIPSGPFRELAAGFSHHCGVRPDDSIVCWGSNRSGQLNASGQPVPRVASSSELCRLGADGEPRCLGPAAPETRVVTEGRNVACGLGPAGNAECWSVLASEEEFIDSALLEPPPGPFSVVAVEFSGAAACGIRPGGAVECWGGLSAARSGEFTTLSVGEASGALQVCAVSGDGGLNCWNDSGALPAPSGSFDSVAAGTDFACGLRTDGNLECWGPRAPTPPSGRFRSLAVSRELGCALGEDRGELACFGSAAALSALAPPVGEFQTFSLFDTQACALTIGGSIACWGSDPGGPVAEPPPGRYVSVRVGQQRSCATRSEGGERCWGPRVPPPGPFTELMTGAWDDYSPRCGLRPGGRIECWGSTDPLQLAVPAGRFRSLAVTTGLMHACGIRRHGEVACWGNSELGQSAAPPGRYRQVASVDDLTCALRDDGRLVCWGQFGNRFDGAMSLRPAPSPSGSFVSIGAGLGGWTPGLSERALVAVDASGAEWWWSTRLLQRPLYTRPARSPAACE